jgi:hypothetical protein
MFWPASIIAAAIALAAYILERQLRVIAKELIVLRRVRARRLKRLIQFYNLRGDLSRPDPELLVELMDTDPGFFIRGPKRPSDVTPPS